MQIITQTEKSIPNENINRNFHFNTSVIKNKCFCGIGIKQNSMLKKKIYLRVEETIS